jgi:hypothetical protein
MKANVIVHAGKIFRQKKYYKKTKYYQCINSKTLACKALLVSNSLSDELNLIRDHNSKCSKHQSFSLSLDETKNTETIQDELKNNITKNEDVVLFVLDEHISEEIEQKKFIQNQRPLFQDHNISKINENSTQNFSNTDSTISNLYHEINSRVNIFVDVKSMSEFEKNECDFRNILELKEKEIEAQIKENLRLKKESEAHAKEARETIIQELEAQNRKIQKEADYHMKELEYHKKKLQETENRMREAEERENLLLEEIKNLKKENHDIFYESDEFSPRYCNSDLNTIQNLILELHKTKDNNLKINFENKTKKTNNFKKNILEKILKHKKPIYLMINQAIEKLLNILKIKNEKIFRKKKIYEIFKKIENYKTRAYKNTFEIIRSYKSKNKCFFCRNWVGKKFFHRHIDECNKYLLKKDFCYKCKRYVVLEIIIDEKILHEHICCRKPKIIKKIKLESKSRWKRRKIGEKRIQRNLLKREIHQKLSGIYLRKIVSNFVNQRRENIIEKIKDIEKGYPEEYLNLYEDKTKITYHFKRFFGNLIGKIGRFYGDTTKEKHFDIKKTLKIYKEHQINFDYIDGISSEQEKTIVEEKIKKSLLNLRKTKIPKFRNVRIYADLIKTYLLACAQRREIDKEMGFPCFSTKILD